MTWRWQREPRVLPSHAQSSEDARIPFTVNSGSGIAPFRDDDQRGFAGTFATDVAQQGSDVVVDLDGDGIVDVTLTNVLLTDLSSDNFQP